jgi:riboflavin-specific deaminase-like protein
MPETAQTPLNARPAVRCLEDLRGLLARAPEFRAARGRPFVVLSYAQSVDGSIAGGNRERIQLSGPESMRLTYGIRALCDAILVGIGTVLADDPRLTVKDVVGPNPQPVVLDTHLRTPPSARIVSRRDTRSWLIHGPEAPRSLARGLIDAGAEPMPCGTGADGRIDLAALMRGLAARSVDSLMVEGGARVLTSFVRQRLADLLIITISPRWIGGLPVVDRLAGQGDFDLRMEEPFFQPLGEDVVLWARARWAGR